MHALLEFLHERLDALGAAHHERRQRRLQVGAGGERAARRAELQRRRLPDHQTLVILLGQFDRLRQTVDDTDGPIVFILVLNDTISTSSSPLDRRPRRAPSRFRTTVRAGGLADRCAGSPTSGARNAWRRRPAASERGTKVLRRRRPRTFGRMHAALLGHRAVEHPRRQRRVRQRLAGLDIFLHPFGDLLPAGRLPVFERTVVPAEAPADREIDVARVVGDRFQMHARCSGTRRGKSPTGTAPADCSIRAAASGARPAALSSGCGRRVRRPCAPPSTYSPVFGSSTLMALPSFL